MIHKPDSRSFKILRASQAIKNLKYPFVIIKDVCDVKLWVYDLSSPHNRYQKSQVHNCSNFGTGVLSILDHATSPADSNVRYWTPLTFFSDSVEVERNPIGLQCRSRPKFRSDPVMVAKTTWNRILNIGSILNLFLVNFTLKNFKYYKFL